MYATAARTWSSQNGALSGISRQIGAVDRKGDYCFTTIGESKAKEMYYGIEGFMILTTREASKPCVATGSMVGYKPCISLTGSPELW